MGPPALARSRVRGDHRRGGCALAMDANAVWDQLRGHQGDGIDLSFVRVGRQPAHSRRWRMQAHSLVPITRMDLGLPVNLLRQSNVKRIYSR